MESPAHMKAVRLGPQSAGTEPYSVTNPAPASALHLFQDLPIPKPAHSGELLVRIKASTIVRDNLTWPEIYSTEHPALPGNDFAGTVVGVFESATAGSEPAPFSAGDEVYGMISAERGGAWAEYAIVTSAEASLKPADLSWEEAAAVPLSALTADQALFSKAGLGDASKDATQRRRVLITGAGGGVGSYLIQFAALAGHHVIAATSSNGRNEAFVKSLGATEAVEYSELANQGGQTYDVIIDTVGGETLLCCWKLVSSKGSLISVDSASWDFVNEHRISGVSAGHEDIQAQFFIVEPSQASMQRISAAISERGLKVFIAATTTLDNVQEAYEGGHNYPQSRGKIVLII